MPLYEILLYYKYIDVADPATFMREHRALCEKLNLKGRIIIAKEGLNGTVEGLKENTSAYCEELKKNPRFSDIQFKKSIGMGTAFPRLSIKVRDEIVSLHLGERDLNPQKITGKYITAKELHDWIHGDKEFYIIDMRNDYEFDVGRFANSIFPELENFRDLDKALPKIDHLKNKTIVTVCTGGVRCEKASGLLLQSGFKEVYQLQGGIVTYMEKYPNQDFLGALYVFDGRITMAFNSSDHPHVIVGSCLKCCQPSENYVNCNYPRCNDHFICCSRCIEQNSIVFCSQKCREAVQLNAINYS